LLCPDHSITNLYKHLVHVCTKTNEEALWVHANPHFVSQVMQESISDTICHTSYMRICSGFVW